MPRLKNGKLIKCQICLKETYFSPSRLLKNKNKTCSKVCLGNLFKGQCKTKIKSNCPICNKEISVKPFHRKKFKGTLTCSRECRKEFLKTEYLGTNNPNSKYQNEIEKFFSIKLSDIKKRSKKEVTISLLDLVEIYNKQMGLCFYTKLPLKMSTTENFKRKGQADLDVVSADRIDSTKGYVKNNIVLCCNALNKMKGNCPQEQFLEFLISIFKENK